MFEAHSTTRRVGNDLLVVDVSELLGYHLVCVQRVFIVSDTRLAKVVEIYVVASFHQIHRGQVRESCAEAVPCGFSLIGSVFLRKSGDFFHDTCFLTEHYVSYELAADESAGFLQSTAFFFELTRVIDK